ncbi:MAG: class I SAM-dependent methyltransferase [Planctomycetota bacterium]
MERRESFNSVARQYGQARPGYPPALAEDLLRLANLPEAARILEVGCGAGQATELIANRGFQVTCLDIGPALIAEARARCGNDPQIEFILSTFEAWTPPVGLAAFEMILAARCWHWIDPTVRFAKAAGLLQPHGCLALLAGSPRHRGTDFSAAMQEIYRRTAPELADRTRLKGHLAWQVADGLAHFGRVEEKEYPCSQVFTAAQYVAVLGTFSDHIVLPPDQRKALYAGIVELIERDYGGQVLEEYVCTLTLFREPRRETK